MNKWLIVALVVGLTLLATAVIGSKVAAAEGPASTAVTVTHVSTSTDFNLPSINSAIQYAEFSNACFGGYTPSGQLFIVNNVELRLRFNQARGWDQIRVNGGPPTALNPDRTQRLIWAPDSLCLIVP